MNTFGILGQAASEPPPDADTIVYKFTIFYGVPILIGIAVSVAVVLVVMFKKK